MYNNIPSNAPQSCPGTTSSVAGKASGCEGCPNQKLCASGNTGQLDNITSTKIASRLENVQSILLILSGKGGVGKSTVTSSLAYGFNALDKTKRIGILDIDITGPSIPNMLGCSNEQVHNSSSGWSPVYINENLSVMSVGLLLSNPDQAVIWRGPKKNKLIEQMLSDVNWTEGDDKDIDLLIIDTPPGTTDEHMSIVQYLKAANVFGKTRALMVTTPQEVALSDVRKQIGFCAKVQLPILGVVGNMDSYSCTNCNFSYYVFPSTTGGIEGLCEEYKLNLIAKLPLDSGVTWCLDNGLSIFGSESEAGGVDYLKKPADLTLTAIEMMIGNLSLLLKETKCL